jgi:hypothetical protein
MAARTNKRMERRATAAIVAGAIVLAGVALACDRSGEEVAGPSSTATAPTIKQARWNFDVRPSAVLSKRLRKKERRRLMEQRGPLKRTVKEVYDALFLDPTKTRGVIERRFVGSASRAMLSARAGVGPGATEVKTLRRTAAIGIDSRSGRRAAAVVFIRARAFIDGDRIRMKHRSTLWLERVKGRWVAIGFQVSQEPLA